MAKTLRCYAYSTAVAYNLEKPLTTPSDRRKKMTLAERLTFRPNEAAEVTGMSRDLIFKLLAAGELRSFKVGSARFIPADALREFMDRKMAEAN